MSSPKDFIPALARFFKRKLTGVAVKPGTDVRTRGNFGAAAWKALVHEINALPAVKAAGVKLELGSIAKARTVKEIAEVVARAARPKATGSPKKGARPKRVRPPAKKKKGGAYWSELDLGTEPPALETRHVRHAGKKMAAPRRPAGPRQVTKKAGQGAHPDVRVSVGDSFDMGGLGSLLDSLAPSRPASAPPPTSPAPPAPPPRPMSASLPRPPAVPRPTTVATSDRPGLTFTLEGPEARQDEAIWGSSFDVVVNYSAIAAGMLGAVSSKKLDEAIAVPSAHLEVVVLPIGFALEGPAEQPLNFRNGHLIVKSPRFRLRAPRRADLSGLGGGPFGISVGLKQSATLIHSFFLEIHLVDWLSDQVRPTPVINFDLDEVAAVKLDSRAGILFIMGEGDSWKVYWNIGGVRSNARVASVVTPAKLKAQYDAFINDDLKKIANNALWRNVGAGMELPKDAASLAAAREAMQATVTAGSKLYSLLSEEEIFRQALERIERMPDGSKIAIVTDSAVFPWELLYPLEYIDGYPEKNYQPKKLWGNRFIFESLLVAPADEKYPSNRRQSGKLRIAMGLNGSIDQEAVWSGRPLLPVKLQKDYFDATLADRGDYAVGHDQVLGVIRKDPPDASLIYFFCHGTADRLEFERTKPVTPFHVFGPEFPNWALVFVNACDAGNISPLSFFSFRNAFRKRKSAGLIAPCFPIPTLFAAVFAKAFIERYAAGDKVGDIMFELRKRLLEADNPLGLWYSLQCPLDLSAPVN